MPTDNPRAEGSALDRVKLLETELEDIVATVQVMCDEHCVVKGEQGIIKNKVSH